MLSGFSDTVSHHEMQALAQGMSYRVEKLGLMAGGLSLHSTPAMKNHVLILGGSRFLGREIAQAFLHNGDAVSIMNRGHRAPLGGVDEVLTCDKDDRAAFEKVLLRRRWDVVVDTILHDEDLAFVIKTVGSGIGHFIHTGSLGVYGKATRLPATEDLPLKEGSDEGDVVFDNKLRQDQVLIRAFQENAFPATLLRQSYIYGAGDIPLEGWGGRSLAFFKMLLKGEPIALPGDGRALLHPGHVHDLARAFVQAAQHPHSIGQIYNVAGPGAVMMRDYLGLIARLLGVEPRFEWGSVPEVIARHGEHLNERGLRFSCQHMCASTLKAKEQLNWSPRISLERGLQENLDWLRQQL